MSSFASTAVWRRVRNLLLCRVAEDAALGTSLAEMQPAYLTVCVKGELNPTLVSGESALRHHHCPLLARSSLASYRSEVLHPQAGQTRSRRHQPREGADVHRK